MKENNKKMISPIIITGLLVSYFLVFLVVISMEQMPLLLRIFIVALPVVFIAVCIHSLKQRIDEIRSGETDDLSKY